MEFELECILIIISCGLIDIEKERVVCRLYALLGAGISPYFLAPWFWGRVRELQKIANK